MVVNPCISSLCMCISSPSISIGGFESAYPAVAARYVTIREGFIQPQSAGASLPVRSRGNARSAHPFAHRFGEHPLAGDTLFDRNGPGLAVGKADQDVEPRLGAQQFDIAPCLLLLAREPEQEQSWRDLDQVPCERRAAPVPAPEIDAQDRHDLLGAAKLEL